MELLRGPQHVNVGSLSGQHHGHCRQGALTVEAGATQAAAGQKMSDRIQVFPRVMLGEARELLYAGAQKEGGRILLVLRWASYARFCQRADRSAWGRISITASNDSAAPVGLPGGRDKRATPYTANPPAEDGERSVSQALGAHLFRNTFDQLEHTARVASGVTSRSAMPFRRWSRSLHLFTQANPLPIQSPADRRERSPDDDVEALLAKQLGSSRPGAVGAFASRRGVTDSQDSGGSHGYSSKRWVASQVPRTLPSAADTSSPATPATLWSHRLRS